VTAPLLEPRDDEPTEVGTVEDDGLAQLRPGAAPAAKRRGARRGVLFWLAVGWLVLVLFAAVFATWLPIPDPNAQTIMDRLSTPSLEHPLGTDGLGRESLSRLVHGARVSLVVSLSAVGIGMTVGGTLGMIAGYTRGLFDTVLMSVINVILAFPGLVLLLVLLAYVGQSLSTISLVIGFLSIPVYTRVARANTLALAQREFVLAAHTMGASKVRILFREIAPNVVLPVAAFGLVAMGVIIVLEGTLAFLGLSVEAPAATWGGMIAEGKRHLHNAPHVALIPSAAMFLTVLSLNFVGDTFRRRFDVRESNL
jgi:peptide/nickel transport system permease protein